MNSPRNPKIRGPARAESGPNWTLRQEVSEGLVQECARGWSCQRMPELAGVLPGLRVSPVKSGILPYTSAGRPSRWQNTRAAAARTSAWFFTLWDD